MEDRFGLGLSWMRGSEEGRDDTFTADMLSLFLEAHLTAGDRWEFGADVELLQWTDFRYLWQPTDEVSFGFLTLRAKVVLHRSQYATLSAGTGLMLPTASSEMWLGADLLGLDPGLYLMLRPWDWLAINASFPVVLQIIPKGDDTAQDPDEGQDTTDVWLTPSVGVAVMPLDWLGAFLDVQVHAWMDPRANIEMDRPMPIQFSTTVGIRLRPLDWLLAEVAVVVPICGDRSADSSAVNGHSEIYPGWDFGIATRIAVTPGWN